MGSGSVAAISIDPVDPADLHRGHATPRHLSDHRPALTIIITDIYSEEWLLEIEGMAVA